MNFNISESDGRGVESGEQEDGEKPESQRASEQAGEHITRAEYVNFARNIEEALQAFSGRISAMEAEISDRGGRVRELEERVGALRELHEDHVDTFEFLIENVQHKSAFKSFSDYERPEALRDESEPAEPGEESEKA